jgi:hypothetical protein
MRSQRELRLPMMDVPGDHYNALVSEAAHRLADTVARYGVLTRERLAALSGEDHWHSVGSAEALRWAINHGMLRRLAPGFYDSAARSSTPSSSDLEAVRDSGASVDRR